MSRICLAAYILGCFTIGYYLVRLRTGQDIRFLGSGSVGARNVGRLYGWPGFAVTLAGDLLKGALAVWAVRRFAQDERLIALGMLAVVTGHIWPIQLGFRGGKGIATSLGALLVWDIQLAFGFICLFVCAYAFLWRTVLAALVAFTFLPILSYCLDWGNGPVKPLGLSILAGVVLLAHRKNLLEEFSKFAAHRDLQSHDHESPL